MIRRLFVMLGVCMSSPASAADQIISVDDAHLQMQAAGDATPLFYSIEPGQSIVVDASAYKFKLPQQLAGKTINSIQLILAKDEQFSAPWLMPGARQSLSMQTLTPKPGSKSFSGFHEVFR